MTDSSPRSANRIESGALRGLARILAAALVAGFARAGTPPVGPAGHAWSPTVTGALAAYRAGPWADAQQLSEQLLKASAAAEVRRDAVVIQAFCLLRSPARTDQTDGRARLTQLQEEDPTLRDEPECNLAYGSAQTALHETPEALESLERAAEGFAAQRLPNRQLGALVALARAWAVHNDWGRMSARFTFRRPQNPDEAAAARRSQIEALRARAAALPGHEDAIAQIDLILGQYLLGAARTADEGRGMLAHLAESALPTAAGSEAAFVLAEHDEQAGRPSAAAALYERLQAEGHDAWQRRAGDRLRELTQPQLVVEAPQRVPTGQAITLHVRARDIDRARVEVRRVDVHEWLANRQTRASDAFLPDSGSVQFVQELDTHAPQKHAWWDSDADGTPLRFAAPPGGYAVVVRGSDTKGQEHKVKRLLLVSDLSSVCFVGPRFVAVWAAAPRGSAAGEESEAPELKPTVTFWMHGSYVAVQAPVVAGVARFPLPNEARVMQDKRWVCLVQAGEQVAVCRGRLEEAASERDGTAQVLMIGGPATAEVGASVYVSGMVLDAARPGGPPALQLRVLDTLDQVVAVRDVPVSAGGAFSMTMPVGSELAGRHIRVIPSLDGRVAENVAGRVTAGVPATDTPQFRIHCEVPRWIPAENPDLSGDVSIECSWGTPPPGARVVCRWQAVQLPTTESNDAPVFGRSFSREGYVDATGHYRLALPLSPTYFGLSRGPLAVRLEIEAHFWGSWEEKDSVDLLLGPRPPHAWLTHEPAEPTTGQEVRFRAGWFDPGSLAVADVPELEVRCADRILARLPLLADPDGLKSEAWWPPEPGEYEAAVSIPVLDREALQLRAAVTVHAASASSASATPRVQCDAHFARQDGRDGVRVRLGGESATPLAVLAAAGDPLGGVGIGRLSGLTEVFLPLDAKSAICTRVVVVGTSDAGTQLLATEPVAADPARSGELRLEATTQPVWPGTLAQVTARLEPAGQAMRGTVVTARLTDVGAAYSGHGPFSRERDEPAGVTPGIAIVGPEGELPTGTGGAAYALPPLLRSALSQGETLWCGVADLEAAGSTLSVPVPNRPGVYRLLATAVAPDGAVAQGTVLLDARHGLRVRPDVPRHLTVGDRTRVSVLVESGERSPVEAELRLDAGSGLHVESLAVVAPNGLIEGARAGEAVPLHLAAHGYLWVHATVEASRAGSGTVVVEVSAGHAESRSERPYEILNLAAAEPAPRAVQIKRTLVIWTPLDQDQAASQPAPDSLDKPEESHRQWIPAPWSPNDRLVPGQYLDVREEFTLSEPSLGAIWTQRVPATCTAIRLTPRDSGPIGLRELGRGDELRFRVSPLAPGPHAHQYYLVVVRPGAAVLPPPDLRSGETPIPVTVVPAEVRLIAVE
jgi:hypothetical protein